MEEEAKLEGVKIDKFILWSTKVPEKMINNSNIEFEGYQKNEVKFLGRLNIGLVLSKEKLKARAEEYQ